MMRDYPHPEDLGLVDDHTDPLGVYCPLCLARPGDPCEQVRNGWITAAPEPHPGDGADWPLGELLKESGRLLWAYGIGEASEYTMHLAMQLRTAALRISDTE